MSLILDSSGSNSRDEVEGPWRARCVSSKSPSMVWDHDNGVVWERNWREQYSPQWGKKQTKKIVSGQTLRSSVDTMEQSSRSSATICCSRTDVLMLWPCKIKSYFCKLQVLALLKRDRVHSTYAVFWHFLTPLPLYAFCNPCTNHRCVRTMCTLPNTEFRCRAARRQHYTFWPQWSATLYSNFWA